MRINFSLAELGVQTEVLTRAGQVVFANEIMADAQFLSQPLTQYAVGWHSENDQLEKTLNFIAPPVQSARKFQYYVHNNKNAFAAEENGGDLRALYGEFKVIKPSGAAVDSRTHSKGLVSLIDRDDISENPMREEQEVARLKAMLLRAEIIRANALLVQAGKNKSLTWTAGKDADSDLMDMLIAGGDTAGIEPSRILFGRTAWAKRILALRGANTAGGFQGASLGPAGLAEYLGVDDILVNKHRYSTSSTTKSGIISSNIVLAFNASGNLSASDPSNIKRFWSPEEGGEWAVYRRERTSKLIEITVCHMSNIVLTSSLGIQKLTIA